jgi:hypothetical protein
MCVTSGEPVCVWGRHASGSDYPSNSRINCLRLRGHFVCRVAVCEARPIAVRFRDCNLNQEWRCSTSVLNDLMDTNESA